MDFAINAISNLPGPERIQAPAAGGGKDAFRVLLEDAVQGVERYRAEAGQSIERLLSGEGEDLHTVALAAQRAELAFDLFLQARNKVVQAYQEIMRMQM